MRKIIRANGLDYDTRLAFVDEAERQGCHLRFAPLDQDLILHGTPRRATLTYSAWVPEPRQMRHVNTLWPRPFPRQWEEDGIPARTITRPIPHPERLMDILRGRH